MINRFFTILFLAIFFTAMLIVYSRSAPASLISMFEARFGSPGTAHVVPECSCTFRYVGTKVQGQDYFIHFRKLD